MAHQSEYSKWLSQFTAKDLLPENFSLVSVNEDDTVPNAIQLLIEKKLLSLPVSKKGSTTSNESSFVGQVDLVDLITFLVGLTKLGKFLSANSSKEIDWDSFVQEENEVFSQMKVSEIITTSANRNPWCAVWEGKPLTSIMDMFSKDANLSLIHI
eukprot:TRINITY_DN1168_c0_g1_i2.p2 TRINITY_DN1168_c0_g1~~TRINITY_DN1168_c0_g1_i2.p2  ORF type:complete len:171 (-),score=36.84 TRINITY_DN1168_c0_g1_i2:26-490(-)